MVVQIDHFHIYRSIINIWNIDKKCGKNLFLNYNTKLISANKKKTKFCVDSFCETIAQLNER